MADTIDSEKVVSDPKTATLSHDIGSDDKSPHTGISSKADDALRMLEEAPDVGLIDPQKSKRLLRRIDIYVMPLICT